MPGAVAGAGVEALFAVLLRLGDHELAVLQVGHAEVHAGAIGLLGELQPRDVHVGRVRVVVPDSAELVRRVLDVLMF